MAFGGWKRSELTQASGLFVYSCNAFLGDIRVARQRELASAMEQVDTEILDARARSRSDLEGAMLV